MPRIKHISTISVKSFEDPCIKHFSSHQIAKFSNRFKTFYGESSLNNSKYSYYMGFHAQGNPSISHKQNVLFYGPPHINSEYIPLVQPIRYRGSPLTLGQFRLPFPKNPVVFKILPKKVRHANLRDRADVPKIQCYSQSLRCH